MSPAMNPAPTFSVTLWRGSELIVTGIECVVVAATSWMALYHRQLARTSCIACTLKWFWNRAATNSAVDAREMAPSPASSAPPSPISITLWNISPAFSAGDSRASRSSARSSADNLGFSNGAMTPS